MTTPAPPPQNPYVGPVPFSHEDPLYGREQELPRLFDLLLAQRIVLLYSPSGAGKTSLIEAKNGLRSLLVDQGFTVWPTIRVNRLPEATAAGHDKTPNRYISSVRHILAPEHAGNEEAPVSAPHRIELPASVVGDANDDERLDVLIFDQFEEILTADPADRSDKVAFFAQLGELLRDRKRWALFAMREDYIAGLDPYLRLIPTRLGTTYRLDLLDPEAARRAIQQPAAANAVDFTDDAARELVRNLRMMRVQGPDGTIESRPGPWVEPVHLQIVCQGLWQSLVVGQGLQRIDVQHLAAPETAGEGQIGADETGDSVDRQLKAYYDGIVAAMARDEQVRAAGLEEADLRSWFDSDLITEQDVRSQLLLSDNRVGDLPAVAVWPLVEKRLVRKEDRRGLVWFELAHDRLIAPIRQSNAAWFRDHPSPLQTLRQQAGLWSQLGEPEDLLLADSALNDAKRIEVEQGDRLSPTERRYLEKSKLHLEQRRARARRLKIGIGSLVAVLLCVAVIAFLARRAERVAERERNKAEVLAVVAQSQHQQLGGQDERAALLAREAYLLAHEKEGTDEIDTVPALRSALGGLRFGLVFRDHRAEVLAVTFKGSNQDQELVSVDRDGVVRRRSLHPHLSREPIDLCAPRDAQESPCAASTIKIAAFSRSGALLALGLNSGDLLIADMDAVDPRPIGTCAFGSSISAISFSADERTLAVADATGLVYLVRIENEPSCERSIVYRADGVSVNALAFDPVRGTLAIGTTNRLVWIDDWVHRLSPWVSDDVPFTGELLETRVKSLAYSADGHFLAAGLDPAEVLLWDLHNPKSRPRSAFGQRVYISTLAFNPDGTLLATGGYDGTVLLRPTEPTAWNNLPAAITRGNLSEVKGVAFSQDGRFLSSGSLDQSIRLWDLDPPGLINLRGETQTIRAVAIDPRSVTAPVIASGSERDTDDEKGTVHIRLWDGSQDPVLQCSSAECRDGTAYALGAAYSPDGTTLATVDGHGCVWLWDTSRSDQEPGNMCTPRSAVLRAVAFDSTGRYVVAGGNSVWIWDREDPATPERLDPPPKIRLEQVWGVAFSPEGDRVFAVGALTKNVLKDRNIGFLYMWTRSNPGGASWKPDGPSKTLWEQWAMIQGLAIHAERGLLAVGDWDGNVHIWRLDALDSAPVTLETGGREVLAVAFDPTGHTLAIAGGDDIVRLWDVDQPLSVPETVSGFRDSLWSIAFSPDGRWLVGGGDDDIVHLWLMDADALAERVCDSVSRNLSVAEWSQYFPDDDYRLTCPNLPPGDGTTDTP